MSLQYKGLILLLGTFYYLRIDIFLQIFDYMYIIKTLFVYVYIEIKTFLPLFVIRCVRITIWNTIRWLRVWFDFIRNLLFWKSNKRCIISYLPCAFDISYCFYITLTKLTNGDMFYGVAVGASAAGTTHL